jgi:succinyl-CoA synthetase beta subunit
MARVKLSEFRAKNLLASELGYKYTGVEIDADDSGSQKKLPEGKLVVKVDQATKKRNKLGLVKLNRKKSEVAGDVKKMSAKGFRYFLAEPMVEHDSDDEHFLALQRTDDGVEILYSDQGGVDIEEHAGSMQTQVVKGKPKPIGKLPGGFLTKLLKVFNATNMSYLEINPLLIHAGKFLPLDAAVEVDSTAELGVQGAWTSDDIRSATTKKTESEKAVEALQATSMAALTLRVMNPDGKILLMLSSGGASLIVADEFDAHGLADELINYGEYSGGPSEDELYEYTMATLKLLKDSRAKEKIIVIAGPRANFTDVAVTFRGIIRAFQKEAKWLKDNKVRVYVRRGGPNEQKGLELMADCLNNIGLKNDVNGPEMSLAELVNRVAKVVKR